MFSFLDQVACVLACHTSSMKRTVSTLEGILEGTGDRRRSLECPGKVLMGARAHWRALKGLTRALEVL